MWPSVSASISTMETGKQVDRSTFLALVLNHLDKVLTRFLVSLSVEDLDDFKAICATIGRRVEVDRAGSKLSGIATDITSGGELVVTDDDGVNVVVGSGEVTVQGIY